MSLQPRTWRLLVAAAAVATALLAGCTSGSSDRTAGGGREPAAEVPLTVMTFNLEYGGTGVDPASVPKAIRAAGADVVAIQEAYGRLPVIARQLGWKYYDTRTQLLSRLPLLSPSGGPGDPVYVEVQPGRYLAVFDVHLDSTRYGPDAAKRGAPASRLLERETERVSEITPIASAAGQLGASGVPTLVMGDFNSPSHQDWTEETVGLRPHVRFPLQWPVTTTLADAELADLYRAQYPDPVADQGLTWPADRPFVAGYNPADNGAPADRIDMIWAGGPVRARDVRIVGESGADVDLTMTPWPSDHRAVTAHLMLSPAATGPLIGSTSRLVEQGDDVEVRWSAGGAEAASVELSADPAVDREVQGGHGSLALPTDGVAPGTYPLSLLDADGQPLATSEVTVVAPGAGPTLTTDRTSYRPGQPIEVAWAAAPGNKWDWVGIYRRDADPAVASYLIWDYTQATVDGRTTLDGTTNASRWPLRPGRYSVYLLVDDSYRAVAQADFTVTGGG